MNRVKVLIEGYAREIDNGWVASSTTTIINLNGKKIIIDPGCNRPELVKKLAENDSKTGDIDYVLLTHSHTDHILLDGIFENAKIVASAEIYDNDKQVDHHDNIPGLDLEIIKTPGHSSDSRTFLIKSDEKTYAVAGDLFWWKDGDEQKTDFESLVDLTDPYVKDKKVLMESRKKILALADYIIPGHGKMLKVE